ncbi:MAG: tetratricopeptide repeat protein [Bacteroidota bacterium]
MKKKSYIVILMFLGILISSEAIAQEIETPVQDINVDDLGTVTDEFQEYFFEALKQKAIENYEKAIVALQKCESLQPENAVVYFELGKNYKALENYNKAISSLQKANRLQPNHEWVLVELMEAFYYDKDFEQAILIAQKLLPFNSKYNENLADLLFESQKYDSLLDLLDKLDSELGLTEYRTGLRQQIYALTKNTPAQIQVLLDAIKLDPENERNYLNLIFVYSEQDMQKEAFETAKNMEKIFPNSKVVHLALYKFHLDSGDTKAALNSMKLILEAEEIDPDSKFKVLNDFLLFVNENPSYEDELLEVAEMFSKSESSPEIYQRFGEYYLIKNQKEKALGYFELGIEKNLDNFDLLRNTLLLQLDLSKLDNALKLSEQALEIFPSQPILYLIQGAALNKQKKFTEALERLTFGLDYLIDDQIMTADFYDQLSITYTGLGNAERAIEFSEKSTQIKKSHN